MTKKAAAKPKKASQKKHSKYYSFTRKHAVLVVVGVLAVLVLGYLGVRQYQINQEKKQFAQAELILADLSKAIQQELGEPISSETSKSCGYSSAKFSKGTLGCGVSFALFYSPREDSAKVTGAKISPIISESKEYTTTYNSLSEDPIFGSTGTDFSINKNSLRCGTTLRETSDSDKQGPGFIVSAGCSKNTKGEYFPVRE